MQMIVGLIGLLCTKVYNVGKCAGKCSSRQECVALSYHNYPTILLRDGTKKQVQAIGRCGCK